MCVISNHPVKPDGMEIIFLWEKVTFVCLESFEVDGWRSSLTPVSSPSLHTSLLRTLSSLLSTLLVSKFLKWFCSTAAIFPPNPTSLCVNIFKSDHGPMYWTKFVVPAWFKQISSKSEVSYSKGFKWIKSNYWISEDKILQNIWRFSGVRG